MFNVIIYKSKDGESELENELKRLAQQSITNKNARIQLNQISYCVELLKRNGTNLPSVITKHIKEDIWELRPGNNRVLYFFFENNTYVLLHMFRKKTQKTPTKEIQKAIKERDDFKWRSGYEKMGKIN